MASKSSLGGIIPTDNEVEAGNESKASHAAMTAATYVSGWRIPQTIAASIYSCD